jgi:nickel transport protein
MYPSHYHDTYVAFTRRWVISLLSAALWVVFCVGPAWAHKVTIFAWVEGDTVYTQSKFSGGKRAKNSTVVVYDKEGNQLLEGKTDENGEFSFQVPKKTDLKVVLKASMGHLAEWTIPAEEITGVAQASDDSAPEVGMEANTSQPQPPSTAVGLSRQEVQALIDKSLDRKLAPILSMLAEAVDSGPRLSEVIGGIGYIFGLVGVALYFSSRGKRK